MNRIRLGLLAFAALVIVSISLALPSRPADAAAQAQPLPLEPNAYASLVGQSVNVKLRGDAQVPVGSGKINGLSGTVLSAEREAIVIQCGFVDSDRPIIHIPHASISVICAPAPATQPQ